MSEKFAGRAVPVRRHRSVEIGVALSMAAFAAVVIFGSVRPASTGVRKDREPAFFRSISGLYSGSSVVNLGSPSSEHPRRSCLPNGASSARSCPCCADGDLRRADSVDRHLRRLRDVDRVFMRWLGGYGWPCCRDCGRGAGGDLPDLRKMVSGAVAERAARGTAGILTGPRWPEDRWE